MKLETKLDQMLPQWPSFRIQFHELWRYDGSWSVNDSWTPRESADRQETISLLRSRWEIFKLNYLPKARVKDLVNIGDRDDCMLEVDCVAFATLTKGICLILNKGE